MDINLIKSTLESYLLINADVIDNEERVAIQREIDNVQKAFDVLLFTDMYHRYGVHNEIYGYRPTFMAIFGDYVADGIEDLKALSDMYDFVNDLWDDNETTGYNELRGYKQDSTGWIKTHGYNLIREYVDGEHELFVDNQSGQCIWNPFYDSTLRFEVDPIEEYGLDQIISLVKSLRG